MAHAQSRSSTELKPASVAGRVTNSLTGDPLAHAHVALRGEPAVWYDMHADEYIATTTADGRFSFKSVTPGTYTVIVERRGFGPLADEHKNYQTLELKPGDQIQDMALQLVPDAVITGHVVDGQGLPVEHIVVRAEGGASPSVTFTDDEGEFRLGGLRAGRYLIKAEAYSQPLPPEIRTDGTVAVRYGSTYFPSSTSAKSAEPVQARAGQETRGIDIKLLPASFLHVSGVLSNVPGDKQPWVILDSGSPTAMPPVRVAGPGFKFAFWQVPPGHYQLFIGNRFFQRSAPAEIDLESSSIEGIHLVYAEPLELKGHVQVEGGAPMTSRSKFFPVLLFQPLGLTERSGSLDHLGAETAFIDPDGSFETGNIPPGRYHLVLENLAENLYIKSASLGESEYKDGVLDLHSSASQTALEIELGVNGARISGVVRGQQGPVAGVEVALFFDDEYGFDLAGKAVTEAGGHYAFHGIAPGKYNLVAYDPKILDRVWSSDTLALYQGGKEKIDVAENDNISQDLKLLTSQ
ncbi:MAG TPA: carboxypeptidase-like regulatory domain-containing protein [Candidatus Saccharimonadales bacterium]|nr:carboxypeptidase-like regulatory domain-containing protein [Candidatus Saccharimonadales bacterium]